MFHKLLCDGKKRLDQSDSYANEQMGLCEIIGARLSLRVYATGCGCRNFFPSDHGRAARIPANLCTAPGNARRSFASSFAAAVRTFHGPSL